MRLYRIIRKTFIMALFCFSIVAIGLWLTAASMWPVFSSAGVREVAVRFLLVRAGPSLGVCWFEGRGSFSFYAKPGSFDIELTYAHDQDNTARDFDLLVGDYGIIGQTLGADGIWNLQLPSWLVIIVLAALPTRSLVRSWFRRRRNSLNPNRLQVVRLRSDGKHVGYVSGMWTNDLFLGLILAWTEFVVLRIGK